MEDKLRYIIYETYKKHGIEGAANALVQYILYADTSCFSEKVRAEILEIKPKEVFTIVAKRCAVMVTDSIKTDTRRENLFKVSNCYVEEILKDKASCLQIYHKNFAMIMEGMQFDIPSHGDLGIEGESLYASSRLGKRIKQEDATIIMKHPQNPNFKIMVVADGIGGNAGGYVASSIAVREIKNWFYNLQPENYEEEEELGTKFLSIIYKINEEVKKDGKGGGTTFVGAIVGRTKTIIANIGDSRAYSYNRGRITRLTKDDSIAQELFNAGEISEEDDMRFYVNNNVITNSINGTRLARPPKLIYLNNSGYEQLILTSDGITDCLSDKQMEEIIENSPPEKVASKLVEAAVYTNSRLRLGLRKNKMLLGYRELFYGETLQKNNSLIGEEEPILYRERIIGGKDNATVAVLINKKVVEERIKEQEETKEQEGTR